MNGFDAVDQIAVDQQFNEDAGAHAGACIGANAQNIIEAQPLVQPGRRTLRRARTQYDRNVRIKGSRLVNRRLKQIKSSVDQVVFPSQWNVTTSAK